MGSWFGSISCGCCNGSSSNNPEDDEENGRTKRCGRGAIMGAWAGNASAGNVFSSWVFFIVLSFSTKLKGYSSTQNGNWILAMHASAGILLFCAILVFFFVRLPNEVGFLNSSQEEDDNDEDPFTSNVNNLNDPLVNSDDPNDSVQNDEAISFCNALFIPGVIQYSLSYLCLKLANYAMFFWLPFYLSHSKADSTGSATSIDVISSSFDYGQILGGFFAGWISDKYNSRAPVVVVMLLLSSGALVPFFGTPSIHLLIIMIPITGFLLGGPANMISSAIAADLGGKVKGEGRALATVTGIIDGTGSLGAALGQYLVFVLSNCGSGSDGASSCTWTPVFIMLVSCTLLAALCISRMCLKDLRQCGVVKNV